MSTFTINRDGIQIKIKGESKHSFGQDLYTQAVTTLISEADVDGWEKHNVETSSKTVDSDALSDFCAAVLVAVTQLWEADGLTLPDEEVDIPGIGKTHLPLSKPVHEILDQLIKDLRNSRYLEDEIAASSRLRPDEPEDLN